MWWLSDVYHRASIDATSAIEQIAAACGRRRAEPERAAHVTGRLRVVTDLATRSYGAGGRGRRRRCAGIGFHAALARQIAQPFRTPLIAVPADIRRRLASLADATPRRVPVRTDAPTRSRLVPAARLRGRRRGPPREPPRRQRLSGRAPRARPTTSGPRSSTDRSRIWLRRPRRAFDCAAEAAGAPVPRRRGERPSGSTRRPPRRGCWPVSGPPSATGSSSPRSGVRRVSKASPQSGRSARRRGGRSLSAVRCSRSCATSSTTPSASRTCSATIPTACSRWQPTRRTRTRSPLGPDLAHQLARKREVDARPLAGRDRDSCRAGPSDRCRMTLGLRTDGRSSRPHSSRPPWPDFLANCGDFAHAAADGRCPRPVVPLGRCYVAGDLDRWLGRNAAAAPRPAALRAAADCDLDAGGRRAARTATATGARPC